MSFPYELYLRGCLYVPGAVVIFNFFLFLTELHNVIGYSKAGKLSTTHMLSVIVLLAFVLFFLYVDGGRLIHGGFYLLSEKESDAIVTEGYIKMIEELDECYMDKIQLDYPYEEANAYRFIIDDVACVGMRKGTFCVGDLVSVVYLPKSGYILSIQKIE